MYLCVIFLGFFSIKKGLFCGFVMCVRMIKKKIVFRMIVEGEKCAWEMSVFSHRTFYVCKVYEVNGCM